MENADIVNTVEDAHRNEEKAIQEVAFILSMQRNLQFFAIQLECLSDHLKVVSTIVKTEPHRAAIEACGQSITAMHDTLGTMRNEVAEAASHMTA